MTIPATDEEVAFRHTHWKTKRALVAAALAGAGCGQNSLDRFQQCGADCVVEIDTKTQKYRCRGQYCHNRHCEPCQKAKSNVLAANLRNRLAENPQGRYRFVTLTLKHSDDELPDQIRRLYKCFKQLRQTKLWKNNTKGGTAILETKWSPDTGEWHVHLHIIAEGEFIRCNDLSQAWHNITGDSFIVDIRAINSGKDAAHYVSKYLCKGTNNEVWSNVEAREQYVVGTRGVRAAFTFGTWRGFKLLQSPKDTGDWTRLGTLTSIAREAIRGEVWAISIMMRLKEEVQYDPGRRRAKKQP